MQITIDNSAARHIIAGLRLIRMRHDLLPKTPADKQALDRIWFDMTDSMTRPVMSDLELDGMAGRIQKLLP